MEGMTSAGVEAGTCQGRKGPGRPRDPRADDAIIDALLTLVVEDQSLDSISMETVAAKAGVGKATIYRRWPNKEALIHDAVARMKGPLPVLAGESVRDDLIVLVGPGPTKKTAKMAKAAACLMPELSRNPQFHEVYKRITEPRRELTRAVLRRGVERGELRADLDIEVTVLLLTSATIARNKVGDLLPHVPAESFAASIVDALLRGANA